MATAKQLAARKLFAARAKAGTLRKPARKKPAAKRAKNPVARTGISKTAYVKRPSQATGKAPTKRLTARRKTVASGKAPKGYFPNPRKAPKKRAVSLPYKVVYQDTAGTMHTDSAFSQFEDAKKHAQNLATEYARHGWKVYIKES